jgi:hypothetical protein
MVPPGPKKAAETPVLQRRELHCPAARLPAGGSWFPPMHNFYLETCIYGIAYVSGLSKTFFQTIVSSCSSGVSG